MHFHIHSIHIHSILIHSGMKSNRWLHFLTGGDAKHNTNTAYGMCLALRPFQLSLQLPLEWVSVYAERMNDERCKGEVLPQKEQL